MKRARTLFASLPFAVVLAAPALAQLPVHAVRGVVFDSVAGAPLPGAIVQAVQLDSASYFTSRGCGPLGHECAPMPATYESGGLSHHERAIDGAGRTTQVRRGWTNGFAQQYLNGGDACLR